MPLKKSGTILKFASMKALMENLLFMKMKGITTIMKKGCIQLLNLNGLTQRGHLRLVKEKECFLEC